jgi:hypothetical protein
MPVFFAKEQHVLIQLETDDDWQSFFQNCEGYITPRDYGLIQDYLKDIAKTIVLEKGYGSSLFCVGSQLIDLPH